MWIKDDTATVWNQLLDPNLNFYHLDLAGGEPMLSVRHFKVLQQLVASGRARDITIHYNTNGSIFPIEHIDLFKQFKSIDIALSIDNIGERFEYERPGVTWESVEENIKNYLAINTPSITISIHATINIQNVYYLPELCDWVQAQNFDNVHFSTLHFPSILSISHVTREARDLVLNRLKVYKRTNPASTKFIDNTIRILESAVLSNGQEFCSYMQNLDSIRNVSFAQTHTPIAIAMGYKRASTN
jgi:hypothetical protein